MTDTYHCDRCDLRFVMEPEADRQLHCLTRHPENVCCHVGERLACADGGVQFAVASPACIVVNPYPVWP